MLISPYLKGEKNKARLKNRTRYFATREGVELLRTETEHLPATKKQTEFIGRLTRSFPSAKEMLEYEDYLEAPSLKTASEFIAQAWEQFVEPLDRRENYLDYVSHRPGVQREGDHGLWNADGKVQNLSAAIDEVANHTGNVWTPVVSLRREDAERLGYADAANWRALVNSVICDIAKGYKIHPDHLKWYAAFHGDTEKHVHIHMVVFSSDPREGYLTKQGIREIKSAFVRQIYRQDMINVYEKQTQYRGALQREAESLMAELIAKMERGGIQNEKLERLTSELAERLKNTSGKKVYGYLPPAVKRIVDEIVDELAKDERVASAYALWQEMRDEVFRTYSEKLPERLPLSRQKEFKPVRNMVIREALKLSDMVFTFEDEGMEDEPEEPEAGQNTAQRSQSVYRQADRYRRAKQTLADDAANQAEKAEAISTLERLWDEGYTPAAHQLGRIYRDGISVTADADAALKWFRLSAEAGNDCSAYALGKLLLERGDASEAIQWLKAAAESGNRYAQYTLGKMYLTGHKVEPDKEQAVRWFTLTAAQGNAYAQYFIDHMDDIRGAPAAAVLRMLHHMGNIFRENSTADAVYTGMQIDKKLRRKLREKKIAQGHKRDDHEQEQNYIMKL